MWNLGITFEMRSKNKKPDKAMKPAEKPVSLHPLKFEEAVKNLLKVEPGKRGGSNGRKRNPSKTRN